MALSQSKQQFCDKFIQQSLQGYDEQAVRGLIYNYILIDVYRESKYIFTVTNLASILVNCFYFLRKITALRPSVLNF